ncbi:MAG: hypothetical protein U0792_24065, partial [Gemmataceae bacterium]
TALETLQLITDVQDERVKNFYRNVFVVLLPSNGQGEPVALPRKMFGEEDGDDFRVDRNKAFGVPLVLPSGGNQLNPQGRYGVPVYPIYHKHIHGNPKAKVPALKAGFLRSVDAVRLFLAGRIERTPDITIEPIVLNRVAAVIHELVRTTDFGGGKKNLGVLVLVRCDEEGIYQLTGGRGLTDRIAESPDGRSVIPNYDRILEAVWEAKIAEGREVGTREGPCSISGDQGEAISAYCKPWPWAFPTWTCPLPGGDEARMVDGIGLSPDTYKALTLGACVFNRLTKRLSSLVLPELFSTGNARPAQDIRRRDWKKLTTIYGSLLVLPVSSNLCGQDAEPFVNGVLSCIGLRKDAASSADDHIDGVVGFEGQIPKSARKDFLLALVYFSGNYTRGDIHLRAYIQDVVPSVIKGLRDIARTEAKRGVQVIREMSRGFTEKQAAYLQRCYESVPYMLARGYGGAFLWSQLEAVLRRKPLDPYRVTVNTARRLESLIPTWPDSRFSVRDEVLFYLHFLNFADRVNRELAQPLGGFVMPLRNWKELLAVIDAGPVESLVELTDPAEIGFASGAVVRWFSRSYYKGMMSSKPTADFLRDRVVTFGSSLRPDAVLHKALRFINELPNNQLRNQIRLNRDLAERAGAVSEAFRMRTVEIDENKDAFLTAFWAGYALQGYDRPRKPKTDTKQPLTTNSE